MRAQELGSGKLVIFDIDDTLVNTDTRVNVVRDGRVIKQLNSHDFTHYKLQPGESFDFGAFKDAREFFTKARPIPGMIRQLKQDIATGNRVIMLTARSDFNDRDVFLDTFRRFGIDMSKVHVYRAGNLAIKAATEEKKKIILKHLLGKEHFDKLIMYDDSVPNLNAFLSLKQEYPWSKFYAWHVDPNGQATEYHRAVDEAFDRPYKGKWEKGDLGDQDMLVKLPDGSNLSIMFNNEGDDEWQVEFWRGHSQAITGQGDQQRIFATVLAAIQKFIKKNKPWRLTFSANKDVEPGQNTESRARLYTRLVDRYAGAWGYEPYAEDHGDQITYELTRSKQTVTEAKLPTAIEEFLDSLNPDDCGVEDIGAYRIHFEGFTSDCKSSADYRRNPEAVYQQVYRDFIQREGGARPLVQDMVGDENFPILFSIFRRKRTVAENKQATARQVLNYINKTHHEPFRPGEKMYRAVMAHPQWQLKRVPLLNLNIPDQEYDDVDYDEYEPESDPYGRVMMVEPEHAGEVSQHLIDKKPIVIDADRYIIDGNHRAWAAKYLLNRDYIMAWVPV